MSDKSGKKGAEPDVSAIDLGRCTAKEFPPGKVEIPEGELRVSIGQRAYDHIQKHAAEESEREICGVMLGDICKDEQGPFLHITEIIRGEHTAGQGAQVTITHETWSHFHKVKDSKFPNKEYLGWYHSHPDFGIFLSSMDLFIHENFFNAPHQVAVVTDPIRREEGLFFWKAGVPERAAKFWVGRKEHKYEPAPEPNAEQLALREMEKKLERMRMRLRGMDEFARSKGEGGWMQTFLLTGILLLLVVMAFMGKFGFGGAKGNSQAEEIRRELSEVHVDPKTKEFVVRHRLLPREFYRGVSKDESTGKSWHIYRIPIEVLVGRDGKGGSGKGDGKEVWKKPEMIDEKKDDKGEEAGSGKAESGKSSGSGSVPHTSPVDPDSEKSKNTGGTEGKGD